jgi:1-deoxy-D-xylulose-5-phosphate synthase
MLSTGYKFNGPAVVRYPRGSGPNVKRDDLLTTIEIGKARLIKEGRSDIVFLNFGALLSEAKIVAEKLDLTLIDMRFVKPLDEEILLKYLENADMFISLEDGSVMGGAGSAVQEFCSHKNIEIKSKLFGIPDTFIEHASREEMIEDAGINASQILDSLNL